MFPPQGHFCNSRYHGGVPRNLLKYALLGIFLLAALVPAAASAFGRWRTIYVMFAQACALAPGILGDYLRTAFYKLTLTECSLSSRISFGSYFAHPDARLGEYSRIGAYCVIGKANIGARTRIASGVQILSGRHQHTRGESGIIVGPGAGADVFTCVSIGAGCWVGAGSIVMADVGAGATIGAGSVVSRPIPPGTIAVGSPARVIKATASQGA